MFSSPLLIALAIVAAVAAALAAFLIYVAIRYAPIVDRIFEEKPLFLPLRVPRVERDVEDVAFPTSDGLELGGSYLPCRTPERIGVVAFCHEFLSDRWSFQPYLDPLRDQGFDIFTFDFRNHGASATEPGYHPLQWVSDREARDLEAALAYLRSRPDRDPAGYGLFGVSRGGGTALAVAAADPSAWGVITDGAFPTRGTMLAYILRWAQIYVGNPFFWKHMPLCLFRYVGWSGRMHSQRRLKCTFLDVERSVSRLSPRPWLMIHGAKDAYIGPDIAKALFALAKPPKEIWIVAGAKHNRCREVGPAAYQARIADFLARSAPRRPVVAGTAVEAAVDSPALSSSALS